MLTIAYPFVASAPASEDDAATWRRPARANIAREKQTLPPTEAAQLDRIRAGDTTALDTIVRTHSPTLIALARLIVGDTDLAHDVVQDVLISLWDRREQLRVDGATIGGYLARAVRNRAISVMRHEHAERRASESILTLTLSYVPQSGTSALEAEEVSIVVRRALDALPPRCREIFLMNRSAGLSYATIAETLGVTIETVHTQMSRATRKLIAAVRTLE